LRDSEETIAKLKHDLSAHDSKIAEVSILNMQTSEYRQAYELKCAELETTKLTLEALTDSHRKTTESLQKLESKSRESESADSLAHASLTRRISDLERENKSQYDAFEMIKNGFSHEIFGLKSEAKKLEEEKIHLFSDIGAMQTKTLYLESELQKHKTDSAELKSRNFELTTEIRQLQMKIEDIMKMERTESHTREQSRDASGGSRSYDTSAAVSISANELQKHEVLLAKHQKEIHDLKSHNSRFESEVETVLAGLSSKVEQSLQLQNSKKENHQKSDHPHVTFKQAARDDSAKFASNKSPFDEVIDDTTDHSGVHEVLGTAFSSC